MAQKPETTFPSPDRLWAEQLAMGLGLLLFLLVFLAIFHAKLLTVGGEVFGPNYIGAYGWASVIGIVAQVVIHELGTIIVAWRLKLPVHFRLFGFGANATATLQSQPRRIWTDALVGIAGPLTGTVFSVILALVYQITDNPFFLGMACVGYFYNLFTLIPILDLEGGWIASAIAPQAWLIGLILTVLEMRYTFNLVLLVFVSFAVPRFVQLLRARLPRTDIACTTRQRVLIAVAFFAMVLGLAWFGTTTFETLPRLILESKGD